MNTNYNHAKSIGMLFILSKMITSIYNVQTIATDHNSSKKYLLNCQPLHKSNSANTNEK